MFWPLVDKVENDAKEHVSDTHDDGELHLVGVQPLHLVVTHLPYLQVTMAMVMTLITLYNKLNECATMMMTDLITAAITIRDPCSMQLLKDVIAFGSHRHKWFQMSRDNNNNNNGDFVNDDNNDDVFHSRDPCQTRRVLYRTVPGRPVRWWSASWRGCPRITSTWLRCARSCNELHH